jgi:HlyD family secretion protein
VFVVRDGRARIQRLAVGPQDEQFRAVSGGLNPGDRVILFPTSSMVDGARVDARPR